MSGDAYRSTETPVMGVFRQVPSDPDVGGSTPPGSVLGFRGGALSGRFSRPSSWLQPQCALAARSAALRQTHQSMGTEGSPPSFPGVLQPDA